MDEKDERLDWNGNQRRGPGQFTIYGGAMGGITARADRSRADTGSGRSLLALISAQENSPSHLGS